MRQRCSERSVALMVPSQRIDRIMFWSHRTVPENVAEEKVFEAVLNCETAIFDSETYGVQLAMRRRIDELYKLGYRAENYRGLSLRRQIIRWDMLDAFREAHGHLEF